MKPLTVPLVMYKDTTFNDVIRLMEPTFVYRNITDIVRGAPVRLTVPAHGLTADWLGWLVGVEQLPDLNREVLKAPPHRLTYIDADTLEVNAISATGTLAKGGQLIYQPPMDLGGATMAFTLYTRPTPQVAYVPSVVTLANGLSKPSPGVIHRDVSIAIIAALSATKTPDGAYSFDITHSPTQTTRYFEGTLHVKQY